MNLIRLTTLEEFLHPISAHVAPLFAFVGNQAYVGGTAVIIANRIAVTASHVIQGITRHFRFSPSSRNLNLDVYIFQYNMGAFWFVSNISYWIGTDIAVLSLSPRNEVARNSVINQLSMTVDPPTEGSRVTAIGYQRTQLIIKENAPDLLSIGLSIFPTISEGKIIQIHPSLRDSVILRFPCFSVNAEFSCGMSGGAVFNEHRELCGLVCSGGDGKLKDFSHAASIWPMTLIPVKIPEDAPPHGAVVPGETYKLLELARLGYLSLNGHERIEFFKHDNGSDGVRRHHER